MSDLFAITDGEHSAVATESLVDTSSADYKGKVSEAAFAYEAVLRGWDVIDAGGAADYDRILKRPNTRPICVQIKRSWRNPQRGFYIINCSRTQRRDGTRLPYSITAFDVLASHLPDIDQWVFYTRAELGNRQKATYLLPQERKNKTSVIACSPRDPNNWSLLSEVAESLTRSQ